MKIQRRIFSIRLVTADKEFILFKPWRDPYICTWHVVVFRFGPLMVTRVDRGSMDWLQ